MTVKRRWHGSLRALGGRLGEQWERDRRDTLFLMAGTLLAAMPHMPHLPWWSSLGFIALFMWRLGLVMSGRALPPHAVLWIGAIACVTAVYDHYDTLFGRDAGVALLMLFLGLKLMEMRARRDLFVVLFLCFFLLLTGFFHSQSMTIGGWTAATMLVLIAAMVTMQFGQREAPIPQRVRMAALLIVQALPIAAVLFVLFPRLQSPLWGVPEDSFSARTGLSDSMAPGRITRLANSDEVAFRVRFDGPAPAESQMYWRGPVFGQFDGETWTAAGRSNTVPLQLRIDPRVKPVRYSVTIEANARASLFALDAPVQLGESIGNDAALAPDMQFVARSPIGQRLRYEVESRLDYRLGLNETPESLESWRRLPADANPRTRELAASWAAEIGDPAQRVDRLLQMFHEQPFRYTMTPPALGRHGIDDFLFDTRSGFCEHYAGALVFMARAMGVPARVVTGYQGAEPNPLDDYWIVRQADAHAWAEVWLPERGWVRVDPVTAVAPERIERGSRASRRLEAGGGTLSSAAELTRHLRLNLDALTNAWNQWVLSYDSARQRRLVTGLGLSFDTWRDVAGLMSVALALLIGAAALFTLHPRMPRDPVERWYRIYCDRLAAVGLDRIPHETAARHLERIARGLDGEQLHHARHIVSLYNNLRYARAAAETGDVQHFRSLVKGFRP